MGLRGTQPTGSIIYTLVSKAWLPHQIQKNNMEQHNNNTMEEDNLGILDQGVACLDLLPILESHEHLGLPRLFSLFKAFVQPCLAWLVWAIPAWFGPRSGLSWHSLGGPFRT
jgi:hypothetical protein